MVTSATMTKMNNIAATHTQKPTTITPIVVTPSIAVTPSRSMDEEADHIVPRKGKASCSTLRRKSVEPIYSNV